MSGARLSVALLLLLASCVPSEPAFVSVLKPTDTTNTIGPYRIEVYVDAGGEVKSLVCRWVTGPNREDYAELPFELVGDDEVGPWVVELAGQPADTVISYYLVLVNDEGALVRYPQNAPDVLASFRVVAANGD